MLESRESALVDGYDLVMFDLDGVVYVGDRSVPGAAESVARLRTNEIHVAFITNNASRPPTAVAEKLSRLGVAAEPPDVVTSAQAAAAVLVERFSAQAPIAVLGGEGLWEAVSEAGLVPVTVDSGQAVALVTGYGPDVRWRQVMSAARRLREGLPWVASNTDLTFPTPQGPAPGHGVMVEMLIRFAGVHPTVAGKPARPLLDETVRRLAGRRPLMVGDRLDTDIEGAHAAGIDSLLVLTGVTGLEELVAATPAQRPTYLAPDLEGLFAGHPVPEAGPGPEDSWVLAGLTGRVAHHRLQVTGQGDPAHWWRVAATAAWHHLDRSGEPPETSGLIPPPSRPAG